MNSAANLIDDPTRGIPKPAHRKGLRWLVIAPKLGLSLLMIAVIALLWAVQNAEHEDQRNTLIGDALWLEQNLRFQLSTSEAKIIQTARTLGNPDTPKSRIDKEFANNSRALINQHPEIARLTFLSTDRRILGVHPSMPNPLQYLSRAGTKQLDDWLDIASRMGKHFYTPLYRAEKDSLQYELVVPIFREGVHAGTLIAVYSFNKLMEASVPWWFAERYQLQILDAEGSVLLNRSMSPQRAVVSYDIPFDAIGSPLILRASTAKPPFNATQRFFAAAIVVLALVVLASLWGIRRQLQGRLAAEQALRESNAFRKSMEDSLITGLRARDLNGRLIYANPAFCQMVGFANDELVGLTAPMPYWAPEAMEDTLRMHQAVIHGKAPREGYEIKLRRKNGELFDALIYEAPLIDGKGQHIGWMGSVLDITERKRSEEFHRQQQEQLQHTARLVSLGEMASTLAHELNQPLAAISSYATGCRNRMESGRLGPDEIGDVVGKITTQAQRAGRIIRQVHDFVKKREPRRERCSVAEVVDEAVTLFEPQARKHGIRIGRRIQGGLPDVLADPTMIEQVVINLLKNASDAVTEGLPNGIALPEKNLIEVEVGGDKQSIVVKVVDRGPGIPADKVEQLFTPFYTTKQEGLGMGLSICRSIIEFHHGRLSLESNPLGGTVFLFSLPIDASPAPDNP